MRCAQTTRGKLIAPQLGPSSSMAQTVYRRVCTDIVNDEWHTVAVPEACTVREIFRRLQMQNVAVKGKVIVDSADIHSPVSHP